MKESPANLRRRIETLEDRSSKLSAAVLRISASLDLETGLREIVGSAREQTGARFGVITTIDDAGQPQDFVTAGLAADEHLGMAAWPDGPRLLAHFRDLPEPLRVADLRGSRNARKGSGVCLMGDLRKSTSKGRDGADKNSWSLVANDCLSAATTRRTDQ